MRTVTRAVPVVVVLVLMTASLRAGQAGAAKPADPAMQVRATLEAINLKFAAAMMRSDAAGAAGAYASDAIVMLPNQPAMKGTAAIQQGLAAMFKEMTVKAFTPKTAEVIVAGDYAFESGTFEMTMQAKGGPAMTDKGKYLTVWKKQADGGWKVLRDINNSDLPPGK
jgi:uncharacterized protein (TIGR02246 family)